MGVILHNSNKSIMLATKSLAMKLKLKIRQKILLYILSITATLYIASVGYILQSSRKTIYADATAKTQLTAEVTANEIAGVFERELSLVRTLAQAFSTYKTLPCDNWQDLFLDMYAPVFKGNPHIYSLWDSWEYNKFVPNYKKAYGRICLITRKENGITIKEKDERSMDGDPVLYGGLKSKNEETIWEPYLDESGTVKDKILMISYCVPVSINNEFVGVVATDVSLKSLQEMVSKIKPVEGSYAYLVSNGGIIAGHPDKELINENITTAFPSEAKEYNLIERIAKGDEFNYIRTDETGKRQLICYAPIVAGKIKTPWAIVLSAPIDVIHAEAKRTMIISLLVSIVGLLIIVVVLLIVSSNITKPIVKMTKSLNRLSQGEMSNDLLIKIDSGDEIEEMSEALNVSLEGLNNKTNFANQIGEGDYTSYLELLSEKDALGKSLIHMRDSLQNAAEEESSRKIEEQKRAWANEGMAKFGEILRQDNDNLQNLCDNVTSELVRYVKANQGGIFLLNDDDKNNRFYELTSTFAWNRKKYVKKQIEEGEGLVGACALEKETIYMTDVPDDYITIASGLGESNPRCIILVPLKNDDNVLGVIEMASFKVLEPFEIEFIQKVAESIAATIQSVRINARTKFLLEQSQMQAEEMKAQEEEMRQNMEELQATQEEVNRKTSEIEGFINSIHGASYVIEYDLNGVITDINDSYLQLVGRNRNEVIGSHHSDDMVLSDKQKAEYTVFWDNLKAGIGKKIRTKIHTKNGIVELLETYIPVRDPDGKITKIMKLAFENNDFISE